MQKIVKISLILGLIFLWVISGFFKKDETAKPVQEERMRVLVKSSVAQTHFVKVYLSGVTEAFNNVVVQSKRSTTFVKRVVKEGAFVKQGQLVAKLDIEDTKSAVSAAVSGYQKAKEEEKMYRYLYKNKVKPRVDYLTKKDAKDSAWKQLERAKLDYNYNFVKAPFAGFIDEYLLDKGDSVSVGTELFRIVNIDKLRVVAYVGEKEIAKLKKGQSVEVKTLSGQKKKGKVVNVSKYGSPQIHTYEVNVLIDNKDRLLSHGMTTSMVIKAEATNVHKINTSALSVGNRGQVGIKTVDLNTKKVKFLEAEVIAHEGDYVFLSGLPKEINVIVSGHGYVTDGDLVEYELR